MSMNDSTGSIGLGLELGLDADGLVPGVDEAQLTEAIRMILQDADLEQLSRRMIRKQLEAQFHTDLSAYKDMINATILELIEQQQQQQEEEVAEEEMEEPEPSDDDDDDDEDENEKTVTRAPARKKHKTSATSSKKKSTAKRKRKTATADNDDEDGESRKGTNGFNMELSLSPELANVVGADMMARPQIVKALWAYIREHNLQDPNNKKTIIFDDTLRNVFQRDSVTMFSMNKFVKRHVRKPEDLPAGGWSEIPRDGMSSDEDTEDKAAKKKANTKRKKKPITGEDDDGEDGKKKRTNPFNTELAISPELAAVVGSDRMARPQIVKALWAYIHANKLQDPSDKRKIIFDNTLRQVFQRDSVTMFSMNKYIKRHARKPQDLPPGGWDDIPRDGLSSGEEEDSKKKKK